jgi:hypothetical protein
MLSWLVMEIRAVIIKTKEKKEKHRKMKFGHFLLEARR